MFWENFYHLCELHGKKPNPVAKELGIASGSLTKWKNGSLPNMQNAIDIAQYFDVSLDMLVWGLSAKHIDNEKISSFISKEDLELLEMLRRLTPNGKERLRVWLEAYLNGVSDTVAAVSEANETQKMAK